MFGESLGFVKLGAQAVSSALACSASIRATSIRDCASRSFVFSPDHVVTWPYHQPVSDLLCLRIPGVVLTTAVCIPGNTPDMTRTASIAMITNCFQYALRMPRSYRQHLTGSDVSRAPSSMPFRPPLISRVTRAISPDTSCSLCWRRTTPRYEPRIRLRQQFRTLQQVNLKTVSTVT